MYRVLLVDDEPIMIKSIEQTIKQMNRQITVVGTARSGRAAIEQANRLRPDIVITDIKMPGINGLEAIRQIKALLPSVHCIVSSAYDYFEFAAEAVALGVDDYLLKPVSEKMLIAAIDKAILHVQDKRRMISENLKLREDVALMRPIVEKSFFSALQDDQVNGADIQIYSQIINGCILGAYVMIFAFNNQQDNAQPVELPSNQQLFNDTLHVLGTRAICQYKASKLVVTIFADQPLSQAQQSKSASTLQRELAGKLAHFDVDSYVGIGRYYRDIAQIQQSYQQALSALQVALNRGLSIYVVHVDQLADYDSVRANHHQMTNNNEIVSCADQYMQRHYQREISLDDIAQAVNLSPYYFSRFYKEQTGENFSTKLSQIRIDHAKRYLLETDISIKELSSRVGYADANYFSKTFKKITGDTPTSYKEKYRK